MLLIINSLSINSLILTLGYVLHQVLVAAQAEYPQSRCLRYPPEDAEIFAYHAGCLQKTFEHKLPRFLSFSEYWREYMQQGGTGTPLHRVAYALNAHTCCVLECEDFFYPSDGAIGRIDQNKRLLFQKVSKNYMYLSFFCLLICVCQ